MIAAICGGSVPVFAKVALEVIPSFNLVFLRFFVGSLFLLPFVLKAKELNFNSFKSMFQVAVIGSLNPILLFIVLQYTQASVSPLIYASIPSMTALYLALSRKQKIPAIKIGGITTGLLGVSIIILLPLFSTSQTEELSIWGNLLIFGAAIAFLTYGLVSKQKQQALNVSPLALTFYFCMVTGLVSIPFMAMEIIDDSQFIHQIGPKHLGASLAVGIFGTSVFYLSYQYALKLSSEITASLFTYIQPVSTVIFAIILLGEKITIPFAIGALLALVGANLASKREAVHFPAVRNKT